MDSRRVELPADRIYLQRFQSSFFPPHFGLLFLFFFCFFSGLELCLLILCFLPVSKKFWGRIYICPLAAVNCD